MWKNIPAELLFAVFLFWISSTVFNKFPPFPLNSGQTAEQYLHHSLSPLRNDTGGRKRRWYEAGGCELFFSLQIHFKLQLCLSWLDWHRKINYSGDTGFQAAVFEWRPNKQGVAGPGPKWKGSLQSGFYEEARSSEGEAPILVKLSPRLNSGKFSPFPLQFYSVFPDFLMLTFLSSLGRQSWMVGCNLR